MMKRPLFFSFLALAIMFMVMRQDGLSLLTPVSPRGILDLEFCKTPERLLQLRLFLDNSAVVRNIYLDFLFIGAYTWFLVTASIFTINRLQWKKWGHWAKGLALSAAFFDAGENFLMLLVWDGRFSPSLMHLVFYIALIKFVLAGLVVLYLLGSLPFLLKRRTSVP